MEPRGVLFFESKLDCSVALGTPPIYRCRTARPRCASSCLCAGRGWNKRTQLGTKLSVPAIRSALAAGDLLREESLRPLKVIRDVPAERADLSFPVTAPRSFTVWASIPKVR